MPTEGMRWEETVTAGSQRSECASIKRRECERARIRVVLRRILHLRLCSTFHRHPAAPHCHGRSFRSVGWSRPRPFAVPAVAWQWQQ